MTRRPLRRRLTLRGELILAVLPTATVVGVLTFVRRLTDEPVLFASLASSAFLIYLDPEHVANRTRTLVGAQMLAATLGWIAFAAFGPGILAAAGAMIVMIALMIPLDLVHPPAVSTSLIFALRAGRSSNLALFALAVAVTVLLVVLERAMLWVLSRHRLSDEDAPS